MKYATLVLAIAVSASALGAHALKPYAEQGLVNIDSWHVAIAQHYYHGLAILVLSAINLLFQWNSRYMNIATTLMYIGIAAFSGSVYLLSTQKLMGVELSFLGPVTPIGGVCLIAGWIFAFLAIGQKASIEKQSVSES